MRRSAFSLIELLVVLAILGLLLAVLIPAVQGAREAARRTHCSSNLRQILIAVTNYEGVYQELPPGSSRGYSCHVNILPFMEQRSLSDLFDQIDFSNGESKIDPLVRRTLVPLYVCPSDGYARMQNERLSPATNYLQFWHGRFARWL